MLLFKIVFFFLFLPRATGAKGGGRKADREGGSDRMKNDMRRDKRREIPVPFHMN